MKKRLIALLASLAIAVSVFPTVALAGNHISFTGASAQVYAALKQRVMEVAAGTRSSTVFEITLEEAGLDSCYYAEDLGVDAVYDEELENYSPEAINAFVEKILDVVEDFPSMVRLLTLELPYEMYWYDKTAEDAEGYALTSLGTSEDFAYMCDYDYDRGDGYLYFAGSGLIYCFPVAQEYADGDIYTVRSAAATDAWSRTAWAQSVVARYVDCADHEKLAGYVKEICDAVTYNNDAVEQDLPYGNAWQPVWVFDENDETNVVCEGYAKAFQYLCDLTEFNSSAIRCYTVSGTMEGGTGAGAHMWNIVAMDDGANYIVDVTNCDGGDLEVDELPFLRGYTSGSPESVYRYVFSGGTLTYEYEDDMWKVYQPTELTLSSEDYVPPTPAAIAAVSMTLSDGVGLNFLVNMNDTPTDGAYMEFTWGADRHDTDGSPTLETDGDYAGAYRFTCAISAKEISDVVHATLRNADGQPVAEFSCAAAEYLAQVKAMGTAEQAAMADAVETYGAAAKAYFLGGEAVSVPEPTDAIASYFSSDSRPADGAISFYGQSLLLRNVMKLRLYFRSPDAPVVTVDGNAVTAAAHTTNGVYDGYYTVDLSILPGQLISAFHVTVQGTNIDFTIGVGDYLAQALQAGGGNTALKELCRAVYWYGQAAQAYMAA